MKNTNVGIMIRVSCETTTVIAAVAKSVFVDSFGDVVEVSFFKLHDRCSPLNLEIHVKLHSGRQVDGVCCIRLEKIPLFVKTAVELGLFVEVLV